MIWRFLVLFNFLTIFAYFDREFGRTEAWVVVAMLMAIVLPLGVIARTLDKIHEELRTRREQGACESTGPMPRAAEIGEGL